MTYADDFIITGTTREILEDTIKPVVIEFLKHRGLELSEEKTKITHIDNGFDFLGFNIRKYGQKLLITPAKKNINEFLSRSRETIKKYGAAKTENLIIHLNQKLSGWANYYRHVVSKCTFRKVDHYIFLAIWAWAKRRHPKKNSAWVYKKYFCTIGLNSWVFNAGMQPYKGRFKLLTLLKASSISIKRHTKIISDANPYNPKYNVYFEKRKSRKRSYDATLGIAGSAKLAS